MSYFREEQQWSETVNTNDSDDEREQVYIQKGKIILKNFISIHYWIDF